jgi:hypothetical protein
VIVPGIDVDETRLAEVCDRYEIAELRVFGSRARGPERPTAISTADAAESLDLSGVLAMLERWRRVARSAQDNPDAHQRMLRNAARLNAGEAVTTVPWEQAKARLGL